MVEGFSVAILAGGSGTRLWPSSRESYPKQFLRLIGDKSLLQIAAIRAINLNSTKKKFAIIGNYQHRFIIAGQMSEIGFDESSYDIILEDEGKNTLPSCIIAVLSSSKAGNENTLVLSSDHYIANEEAFKGSILEANEMGLQKYLVTFGITPTHPHTGYGYVKTAENSQIVEKFLEKPSAEKAEEYIKNGYLWNSGMFMFNNEIFLEEAEKFERECYNLSKEAFETGKTEYSFTRLNQEFFSKISPQSVDYGVMEKSGRVAAIACKNIGWNDLGDWQTMAKIHESDEDNVITHNSENCFVKNNSDSVIAISDLSNITVIAERDAFLIVPNDKTQNVKNIVSALKDRAIRQAKANSFDYRPWGYYEIISDTMHYKIKKIIVKPEQQLSLQMHHKRSEHWVIISGTAEVTLNDDIKTLLKDESVYIPRQAKHRIKNASKSEDLVFVEVQCGDYFGEDDIIRFEDKWGRA